MQVLCNGSCPASSIHQSRGFQPLSRCGPHRNSKLGWQTSWPKAHQLQPFVLLVGPEHVLLRLLTQTAWILLIAKLRAQHLKVIAHTEITSVSKIKQSPKIFTSGMLIIQCSVQWEGCACFALQSLSKRGGMRDKHAYVMFSVQSWPVLGLYRSNSRKCSFAQVRRRKWQQDIDGFVWQQRVFCKEVCQQFVVLV